MTLALLLLACTTTPTNEAPTAPGLVFLGEVDCYTPAPIVTEGEEAALLMVWQCLEYAEGDSEPDGVIECSPGAYTIQATTEGVEVTVWCDSAYGHAAVWEWR